MQLPQLIDAATVERVLTYPALIERLSASFVNPPVAPPRQSLPIEAVDGHGPGQVLVMPAVRAGGWIGLKVVTVHPDLGARPGGALRSTYLVLDARSGELVALIDGHTLTRRRTAATSVLATKLLRPGPIGTLLVVGTGDVARGLAQAYAEVLAPHVILIWGRRAAAANGVVEWLAARGVVARAALDLSSAVGVADVVTAATLSEAPLIHRSAVRPGTHVDLVGGFTPVMREADDALVMEARLVVDTEQAVREAGDLVQPITAGLVDAQRVVTLADLLTGRARVQRGEGDITLFKSVGHALEDLAAAELILESLAGA